MATELLRSSTTCGPAPEGAARGAARSHVIAVLPRGEAIRNFTHSGSLDAVAREAELSLLSVVPDAECFDSLALRYGRVIPLEEPAERYPVRLLRDVLDMAHGRHLWSAAARERWRLRDHEARSLSQKVKRIGRKALARPFASRRGVALLERAERTASRVLSTTDRYVELYRQLGPTLVFNGSHVHSRNAIAAVHAARWLGIPTATFIFSWDNLTSQGRVLPAYDDYLVWNDDLKRQLLAIYPAVRPDRVHVTGTPQFDLHFREEMHWSREEFCARVGADPARPIVLYSTGMAEHMPGEPLVVEQIADMLGETRDLGAPQLLVRVYPKDRTGRFADLERRRPDILFPRAKWVDAWLTPTVEDDQLYTNTLRHVAAGVNVASTVSLELAMFDKPVINVGYNPPGIRPRVDYVRYYDFDHYAPLVRERAVALARSAEEMRTLLHLALSDPGAGRADREAFIARMFGGTLDGRSGERVAAVLLRLAARRAAHT
ncbi:MAG: hypothetical protein HOQ11_01050 [Gemmatimonadaceae bacterium]|nr:hypothetical protein [Gemmatimonadaceae bacterium]